jgi:sugar phosphate isomerase/epimerase
MHSTTQQSIMLCSTAALVRYRTRGTDHQQVIERCWWAMREGISSFELLVDPFWYSHLDMVAADLLGSNISFPVLHADKRIGSALSSSDPAQQSQGIQWWQRNCHLATLLGVHLLVLHLWGMPELDGYFERNLHALQHCLDIAARYDLTVAIETLPCRCETPLERVQQAIETDRRCTIALDLGFLALHRQLFHLLASSWLWTPSLVRHVHVKGHPKPEAGHDEVELFFSQQFLPYLAQHHFTGSISLETPLWDQNGTMDKHILRQYVRDLTASAWPVSVSREE